MELPPQSIWKREHGLVVTPRLQHGQQPKVSKEVEQGVRKLPADAATQQTRSATAGDALPSTDKKRAKRSAQRLLVFQEKKRAAFVAELMAKLAAEESARADLEHMRRALHAVLDDRPRTHVRRGSQGVGARGLCRVLRRVWLGRSSRSRQPARVRNTEPSSGVAPRPRHAAVTRGDAI